MVELVCQHLDGLLVVDKPRGPSSHDVVNCVRKTLGIRAVGHAGTLDPMATGVLLVLVGSCTKLSRFIANHEKVYRAVVVFGTSTDTLDAMGQVTHTTPIEPWLADELDAVGALVEKRKHETASLRMNCATERVLLQPTDLWRLEGVGLAEVAGAANCSRMANALKIEVERTEQVPPIYSAIKQQGKALYKRARQGEAIEAASRHVRVMQITVADATGTQAGMYRNDMACTSGISGPTLVVQMHVSKGYYVRCFARDLARSLGVAAHLGALQRMQSASWCLHQAVGLNVSASEMKKAVVPIEQVVKQELDVVSMTSQGALRALQGKSLTDDDFLSPVPLKPSAWFDTTGRLVAVGDRRNGRPKVLRAFLHARQMC